VKIVARLVLVNTVVLLSGLNPVIQSYDGSKAVLTLSNKHLPALQQVVGPHVFGFPWYGHYCSSVVLTEFCSSKPYSALTILYLFFIRIMFTLLPNHTLAVSFTAVNIKKLPNTVIGHVFYRKYLGNNDNNLIGKVLPFTPIKLDVKPTTKPNRNRPVHRPPLPRTTCWRWSTTSCPSARHVPARGWGTRTQNDPCLNCRARYAGMSVGQEVWKETNSRINYN